MIQSAMFTTKLRVRPLVGFLQHSDVWEGPCRAGRWESLKPEAEKEWAKKMFPQFVDQLKDVIPQVEILEPLAVPYLETMTVSQLSLIHISHQIRDAEMLGGKILQF